MIKVLHIIDYLCLGGAARSMIAISKYSSRLEPQFHHQVISLKKPDPRAIELALQAGMEYLEYQDEKERNEIIATADIVQIQYWNSPQMFSFLHSDLSLTRLMIWFHVSGDHPPQVITRDLINYADFAIPCNPHSYELPVIQQLNPEIRHKKVGMVYDAADFERVQNVQPQPHQGFNVGYMGSLSFSKMHPNYIAMSAKANIPDVKFILCGGGTIDLLQQQAKELNALHKFDFRGFVEDIASQIAKFDIYGYPLCEDTYAAAELNLQEVMYAGIPPVVFPHGGIKKLIIDNYTGLVVNSELEYTQALEYLYHNPQERLRLGKNAKEYASQIFGAENAAKQLNPIYHRLLEKPKRSRQWSIPTDGSLLDEPVSLLDLVHIPSQFNGAKTFIESLGNTAPQFLTNLTSQDPNELFATDEKIANSSTLLGAGEGGILQYLCYFPEDGYLSFWTALVLEKQGQIKEALGQFILAINRGCNHWRVHFYAARLAYKFNQLNLAEQYVRNVLKIVPNFGEAQKLLEEITNSFGIKFQTFNLIIFPDWSQSEEDLVQPLTEVFHSIASYPQEADITLIIDVTKATNKEDAQQLVSWVTMNVMEEIPLPESLEIAFISNLTPQQWEQVFIRMGNNQLYHLPFSIISQWENVPESALESYCKYLWQSCDIFWHNNDPEKYLDYCENLLKQIVEKLQTNRHSQFWQKIAQLSAQNCYLLPCYFNDQNLKELYVNRAKILEFTLRINGYQLDYEFPAKELEQEKIKIGILAYHYGVQTETFATLPIYNHLDRAKFDITLFTFVVNNHPLEKYCFTHGDRVIHLPSTLLEQVKIIRSHELDILFIGSNITTKTYNFGYLTLHRLARIQIIDPNSPVSSGFSSIDYYISSKLSEPLANAQDHYSEELITLDILPQCFDFGTEANLKMEQIITRESLGLKSGQIVFVSGANYYKITPELEETWVKILTKVPNSVLVLYPFNPNWSNNYPISLFKKRILNTLQKYNLTEDRLIIFEPVKNSLEVQERLKVCDLYLDSFPYSGMSSMIDPLSVYLPTLVYSGNTSRSQKAASILRYLDLENLIAYSPEEYIEKAILLAQNPELRQQYREQIKQKMQSNPSFLDSKKYSQQIQQVLLNLYEKYQRENTLREFNLGETNYLIFPHWTTNEEELTEELYNVIHKLAILPSPSRREVGGEVATLVIDTTGTTKDDANLVLTHIVMRLMEEEELDLENKLDFSLISNLTKQQWAKLLPKITAKITLENENQEAINQANLEEIISINGIY